MNVDIYRNGVVVITTANDGFYTDSPGDRGHATYIYQVALKPVLIKRR
jgi:hypothetical protein